MVLWKAGFTKELNQDVNDFNSSIAFDKRLYKQDIKGSLAHVRMLMKQEIISTDEGNKIIEALDKIEKEIEENKLMIDPLAEDIHMFIEEILTKRLGATGKRLHTARSRNDQVALDMRLYGLDISKHIIEELTLLIETLIILAKENVETIMPGYTHMQRAQPITFGHHIMAYVEMFLRDIERLQEGSNRMAYSPLGSGALATSTYPIDREYVASLLGLNGVCQNSLDAIGDRDFVIEMLNDFSFIMMHLSRLSEEIILWASFEFQYIALDDAYATGSSMMPQKKNPDICELIRGKSGRVFGHLLGVLTMMKGLPLAYNKDMQEDKEALFDSVDTIRMCLKTIHPMIKTMQVNKEKMEQVATQGFLNATDVADYLVKKGLPFREAYEIVGRIVHYAVSKQQTLDTLSIDLYQSYCSLFDKDIHEVISLKQCINNRDVIGGPSPKRVKEHIEKVEMKLGEIKQWIN